MPYANNSELPPAIKKLPQAAQNVFRETFNHIYTTKKSESKAFAIAWSVVKKRLKKSKGKYVAMSSDFETVHLVTFDLNLEPSKIIANADSNEIILEAPLATTDRNSQGYFLTEEELNILAEQINKDGSTLPDIEHEVLHRLVRQYGKQPDLIREALKREKGLFNSIRAVVDNGKLWIQTHLDKSKYLKNTSRFNKLSIELFADTDIITGRMTNPKYLGFTLTSNPSIKSIDPIIVKA